MAMKSIFLKKYKKYDEFHYITRPTHIYGNMKNKGG